MARIEQYEAKDVKLTPSNVGFSAIETAGRRISTFTEQSAHEAQEIGNLQNQADEAIGRTMTAFLRYRGLSTEGGGFKTAGGGKGGGNTLIGTGSGDASAWNARANASMDARPKASVATINAVTEARQKLINDQTVAKQEQDHAKLLADRANEDATVKTNRMSEDDEIKAQRLNQDTVPVDPNDPSKGNTIRTVPPDVLAQRMQEDNTLKLSRADEDAQLKQKRDAEDAQIIANKNAAQQAIDYQTLRDMSNGMPKLASIAAQQVSRNSPVPPPNNRDFPTIPGQTPPAAQPQHGPLSTPAAGADYGNFTPEQNETQNTPQSTDWTGMGEALGGTPPSSGELGGNPPPSQEGQTIPIAPSQPDTSSGPLYPYATPPNQVPPVDQPGVPAIYSDMTGGM